MIKRTVLPIVLCLSIFRSAAFAQAVRVCGRLGGSENGVPSTGTPV